MKQLQRLLFQQGNRCFFCAEPIPEGQASVEHLDALSNGGVKSDRNCVVCCRAVNLALGNLSVKEKFRAILCQPSPFTCPSVSQAGLVAARDESDAEDERVAEGLIEDVIANLRKQGIARPTRLATLGNHVRNSFATVNQAVYEHLLERLRERGVVKDDGDRVEYPAFGDRS
jgi:hypothetical protein